MGHVRILDNLVRGDNTDGPTWKTGYDAAVIVNPIGQELAVGAANPISSVAVLDSYRLVEPPFAFENADKLLKDIRRSLFLRIDSRYLSGFHLAPFFLGLKSRGFRG